MSVSGEWRERLGVGTGTGVGMGVWHWRGDGRLAPHLPVVANLARQASD